MKPIVSRRQFLASTAVASIGLTTLGAKTSPAAPVFAQRGYYVLPCRTPTLGYEACRDMVDCMADDQANTVILWIAGGFRSKKFPVTWQYNADHANVRHDFIGRLIRHAHQRGVKCLLGFTPFGYDGVNQYPREHPERKAIGLDGKPVAEFGIHCWGWNLCPAKAESQRFMIEYAREMACRVLSRGGRPVHRVERLRHLPLCRMRGKTFRSRVQVRPGHFGGSVDAETGRDRRGLSALFLRSETAVCIHRGGGYEAALRSTVDTVLHAPQRGD